MEGINISDPMQFFQMMMPAFHQNLSLPQAVSKEVEKMKMKTAFLESRMGRWRVSLCRDKENGLICLEQGWPQFVESHALKDGEFVFFKHTGDLHFNVSVYKTDSWENMFLDDKEEETLVPPNKSTMVDVDVDVEEEETLTPPKKITIVDEDDEEEETLNPPNKSTIEEEEEEVEWDERLSFEKRMIPSYATKFALVSIPIGFMRRHKLGLECRKVVLIDPIEREWDVMLTGSHGAGRLRSRMRTGWRGFYVSNALNDGDVCVFRLNRRLLTTTTAVFNVMIVRAN